jgi:hypothetical protein
VVAASAWVVDWDSERWKAGDGCGPIARLGQRADGINQ